MDLNAAASPFGAGRDLDPADPIVILQERDSALDALGRVQRGPALLDDLPDRERVREAFALSPDELAAALAYYEQNKSVIEARLLLNRA